MENQQSPSTYLVGATQFPNPLAAALHAVTARVQQRAEHVGLPDVLLGARLILNAGQPTLGFSLLAKAAGREWSDALVQVAGATLEEAEALFYNELDAAELSAYEDDPSRFIDAQIEQFQQQEAYA